MKARYIDMAKKMSKAHDAIIFGKLFSYCQEKAERKRRRDGKIHLINLSLSKQETETFISEIDKKGIKTTPEQIKKILQRFSRPMILSQVA